MKASSRRLWIAGLGIALLVALLSPLASPHPDGLERVAALGRELAHGAHHPCSNGVP